MSTLYIYIKISLRFSLVRAEVAKARIAKDRGNQSKCGDYVKMNITSYKLFQK